MQDKIRKGKRKEREGWSSAWKLRTPNALNTGQHSHVGEGEQHVQCWALGVLELVAHLLHAPRPLPQRLIALRSRRGGRGSLALQQRWYLQQTLRPGKGAQWKP